MKGLVKKGLVSYSLEKRKKLFKAENPERLFKILNKDKEELINAVSLMSKKYKVMPQQATHFLRGIESLKAILNDEISTNKPVFVIGAAEVPDKLKGYFDRYYKRREKWKIPISLLFSEASRGKIGKIPLSNIRFLPEEYIGPATVEVYGDNIAIILWQEDILVISIRRKEVAESYRSYFKFLWGIGTK